MGESLTETPMFRIPLALALLLALVPSLALAQWSEAMPDFAAFERAIGLKPGQKVQFDRAAGATKRALISSATAALEMKDRLQTELAKPEPDFLGLIAAQNAIVEMQKPLFREAAQEWQQLYATLDPRQAARAREYIEDKLRAFSAILPSP
jgi:hypothetical protein